MLAQIVLFDARVVDDGKKVTAADVTSYLVERELGAREAHGEVEAKVTV